MTQTTLTKLLILTGDASSDTHASWVIKQFKAQHPSVEIHAVGGPEMAAAGAHLIETQDKLRVLGMGAFLKIPQHIALGKRILEHIADWQPEAVLLMDYGGFHLRLLSHLRKRFPELKIGYYIPPQLWVSRPGRIKHMKNTVNCVFCIFPFEKAIYENQGIPVTYVGHPLLEQTEPLPTYTDFCAEHGLDASKKMVGLFPGSRKSEINCLTSTMLECLPLISAKANDSLQFVLAKASSVDDDLLASYMMPYKDILAKYPVKIIPNKPGVILGLSKACILASGTISLQATMYGTPSVIIYKVNRFLYGIARHFLLISFFGLPNILANRLVMPELLNKQANPERITQEMLAILNASDAEYEKNRSTLSGIKDTLQCDAQSASLNVMNGLLELVENKSKTPQKDIQLAL